MMKILYISSATLPSQTANSLHVMKTAQAFTQQGHGVELLAPLGFSEATETAIDLWKRYGITDLFPIRWLPCKDFLRDPSYALRAAHDAWKLKPHGVFSQDLLAATVTAWLGIPTIYEAHAPPQTSWAKWNLRRLMHAPGFEKLIVLSHAMKEQFLPFTKQSERIHVLPGGVDFPQFKELPEPAKARQLLGLEPGKKALGYASHFLGNEEMRWIFELAKHRKEEQFLILAGTHKDLETYSPLAHQKNLSNVVMKGFIDNQDLPLHLAACDVLLLPGQLSGQAQPHKNLLACPLKLFEYMACRRVVVASDLPVLREVLNEKNSVLCDPSHPKNWLDALEKIAHAPQWKNQLAQQAQKDALNYSWQARVDAILAGKR